MTILTDYDRHQIIDRWRMGFHTQLQLAVDFGTTQSAVSKVIAKARREDAIVRSVRQARPRVYNASQMGSLRQPLDMDWL